MKKFAMKHLPFQLVARFPAQWDATQNALNSLEQGSVNALNQLEGPLDITVYVTQQDAKQGDVRKLVREFVALYQRYKSDISLTFVDPLKEPEAVRKSGIQGNGEMVVEFGGRREHITTLNEQTLTSALLRLARNKEQLLMYVSGHGERKLDGAANHDLGEFGRRLQQNGYRIAPLNLTVAQDVPDNVGVLVITQPQTWLFPGETTKLQRYIERGGNVLWLLDAEPLRGLEPIAVFPYARALGMEENRDWQRNILVEGAMNGWVSSNRNKRFDKTRDIPGPVDLALALQRNVDEREQRIVVVGSGSFLSNAYSGNGGNLDLGVNMLNWLSNEERLITLAPHTAKDGTLTLSTRQLTVLSYSLLVVLPLLLIAIGGWMWWRRR
jgi:hypothetical protein